MATKSINETETKATAIARTKLIEPLKVAERVLRLATMLQANDIPEKKIPRIKFVRLLLLQRIQNDLRCCVILVERGYSLQAAALAAGIYEAWVMLANISTDEDASAWLSHARETKALAAELIR